MALEVMWKYIKVAEYLGRRNTVPSKRWLSCKLIPTESGFHSGKLDPNSWPFNEASAGNKKALKGVAAFCFDKAWNYDTRSRYTPFRSQDTLDLEGTWFPNFLLSSISCPKGINVFSVLFPFSKILSCIPCGDANESAFFFSKGLLLFNQLILLRPTQKNLLLLYTWL